MSNVENLNPQVLRHIGRELQSLKSEPMEGITVLLDDKDMTFVEAIIDGPAETPYHGGKFRVRLTIGQDFPQVSDLQPGFRHRILKRLIAKGSLGVVPELV